MNAEVELRPGVTPLAEWRAVYRGASITLDPVARADVEAGKAALTAILSKNGLVPTAEMSSNGSPSIAELIEKRSEPLPNGLLRLFVALKLTSLAQGMSGVRWSVIRAMTGFLASDLLPVVPARHVTDRLALSQLFGALTGTGEVLQSGRLFPAQKALREAGLEPVTLNSRERSALLSGTQLSVAAALAGLFEAERALQSAIVAAALSASHIPDPPLHASVHRLHRQRGQMEVAAAFRQLLGPEGGGAVRALHDEGQSIVGRCSFRLGACLDLLRHAGALLERAANSVSENSLVLWQREEIVTGAEDLSSVALASDLIALALRTVGDLAETRIVNVASRIGPAKSDAGEDSGGLVAKAATFASENRARALATSLDPAGVWRLLPMAGTASLVIAIECLEATRAVEAAHDAAPPGLGDVWRSLSDVARPQRETGVVAASNLASVAVLVSSGALASAAGIALPSLTPHPLERPAFRLGVRAKGS